MNQDDYKRAMSKLEPDGAFEKRIKERVTETERRSPFEPQRTKQLVSQARRRSLVPLQRLSFRWTAISVLLIVFMCGSILLMFNRHDSSQAPPQLAEGAVWIPKLELPKRSTANMDMIGLIVYQGRIYTQTATYIPPEAAKSVVGEKIGRTKGGIDEWSSQSEFAKEFASTIGEQDVYTVKGYDRDFRLMTYQVAEGQTYAEFYECLNGIAVTRGADLVSKLKLVGNIESAYSESFDSWNGGKRDFHPLPDMLPLQPFLEALDRAKPMAWEPLYSQGIYNMPRKFLILKLKDRTEVRLDLFEGGYVRYGNVPLFLEPDKISFDAMWGLLR